MKLSIVATLYQSAPYIDEFCRRVDQVAQEYAGNDYEIVLVNDGSPDDSLDKAIALSKLNDHIAVVDLSRNFGHHKAMMAGLEQSIGDHVFLLDSDLEEEPESLRDFSTCMKSENADVVFGVQKNRKGNLFERISGHLSYSVYNLFLDIDHPRNIVTARLMSRRYVDALLMHKEREMVISCLWVITGFHQVPLPIEKHGSSDTTYGLSRKIGYFINVITSFSTKPLTMISSLGLLIFMVSLVYAFILTINSLVMERPVDGWTSIMVSIWLLGGLIISFVGIIGIYVAKIFIEVKSRPYVVIRSVHGEKRK